MAPGMASAGVLIQPSSGTDRAATTTMSPTPAIQARVKAVADTEARDSLSPAPKRCPTTTVAPTDRPMSSMRKVATTVPATETADTSAVAAYRPTI